MDGAKDHEIPDANLDLMRYVTLSLSAHRSVSCSGGSVPCNCLLASRDNGRALAAAAAAEEGHQHFAAFDGSFVCLLR